MTWSRSNPSTLQPSLRLVYICNKKILKLELCSSKLFIYNNMYNNYIQLNLINEFVSGYDATAEQKCSKERGLGTVTDQSRS